MSEPVYDYSVGSETQSINKNVKIKRQDQHLRVCKSLIFFYEKEKEKLPPYLKNMIKNNIINMILCNEYTLLWSLTSTDQSYKELKEFDSFLKNTSPDLYNPDLYVGIENLNSGKN